MQNQKIKICYLVGNFQPCGSYIHTKKKIEFDHLNLHGIYYSKCVNLGGALCIGNDDGGYNNYDDIFRFIRNHSFNAQRKVTLSDIVFFSSVIGYCSWIRGNKISEILVCRKKVIPDQS